MSSHQEETEDTVQPSQEVAVQEYTEDTTSPRGPNDTMSLLNHHQNKDTASSDDDENGNHNNVSPSSLVGNKDNHNITNGSEHQEEDEDNQEDGLSEYERLRLRRIQRNQARLKELGLLNNNTNNTSAKKRSARKKKPQTATKQQDQDQQEQQRQQPKRGAKEQVYQNHNAIYNVDEHWSRRIMKRRKRQTRCGNCAGCTREEDCGTCVYCAERIQGNLRARRCLFKHCLQAETEQQQDQQQQEEEQDEPQEEATENPKATADNEGAEEEEEEDHHNDFCHVCNDGGDLILCSGCDRGFHSNCHDPKIRTLPPDDWLCMECHPAGALIAVLPSSSSSSSSNKQPKKKRIVQVKIIEPTVTCQGCQQPEADDSKMTHCKACDAYFHLHCHDPPIEQKPKGGALRWWKCAACKQANAPILEQYQMPTKPKTPKTPTAKPAPKPKNLKLFEGEHDDDCYICYNGGELVCCDFCSKVFHLKCHIPALPAIPTGIWKCCECYAIERTRMTRCGECKACLAEDCGKCQFCLDRPKFGGPNKLKQTCLHRECPYRSYAETFVPGRIPGEIAHHHAASKSKTTNKEDSANKKRESTIDTDDAPKKKQARTEEGGRYSTAGATINRDGEGTIAFNNDEAHMMATNNNNHMMMAMTTNNNNHMTMLSTNNMMFPPSFPPNNGPPFPPNNGPPQDPFSPYFFPFY